MNEMLQATISQYKANVNHAFLFYIMFFANSQYNLIWRKVLIHLCRKSNILDNMISILEKYADNLEDIVENRTLQLLEEKKKTDNLLHQMLPR